MGQETPQQLAMTATDLDLYAAVREPVGPATEPMNADRQLAAVRWPEASVTIRRASGIGSTPTCGCTTPWG